MMKIADNVRTIQITTLENKSGKAIEDWIAEWNDENEPVQIISQTEIWIGNEGDEVDYRPIKWKCPDCGRWNYQLAFMNSCGAMACCQYCHECNEF